MTATALRVRAVGWAVVALGAVALPATRSLLAPGSAGGAFAAAGGGVAAAGLAGARLRRAGWTRRQRPSGATAHWPALAVVACGEELLFRGALLRGLARVAAPAPAILASSVAFGLAHRPGGRGRDALVHVVTGLGFGGVAWVTGGWLAAAELHLAYNVVASGWVPARAPADRTAVQAGRAALDAP